jgi:hypothetical protein
MCGNTPQRQGTRTGGGVRTSLLNAQCACALHIRSGHSRCVAGECAAVALFLLCGKHKIQSFIHNIRRGPSPYLHSYRLSGRNLHGVPSRANPWYAKPRKVSLLLFPPWVILYFSNKSSMAQPLRTGLVQLERFDKRHAVQ